MDRHAAIDRDTAHTHPIVLHPDDTSSPCSIPPSAGPSNCSNCAVRHFCLPSWADPGARAVFDRIRISRRRVRKGQPVFHEGDRCDFIYAVHFGSFKSTSALRDGHEQVVSFHLPGELFGFDGLDDGRHPTTARALEDAEVCVVPYAELDQMAGEQRSVREHITHMFVAELVRERRLMSLIANTLSEERVAAFLLGLSQRLSDRGYSPREFQLRMTREDIGSYLGTSLETVSRCLSSLARQGHLLVHRRHIQIVDVPGLQASCQLRA